MMPSPQEQTTQTANSAQQNAPMEVNSSQYSSCETLDSHRSSEYDDEANGSDEKGKRSRRISSENSDYIAKERVTKAAPPKPAYNPMQFIAQKPSNLFQTAQAQLKKAEEVKKTKETTVREEPEEWQNNLDNWKSSRRKRVEHIIDRVVEVKKLEEEEIDRNRKKSKTINELMEKRGALKKIPVYTEEDDAIDMSGLNDVNDSKDPGDNIYENNNNNNDSHVDLEQSQSTNITKQVNETIATEVFQTAKSDFHSTALVRDVIQKTQVEYSREKMEDISNTNNKSYITSMNLKFSRETFGNSQERDGYDDAIEGYKNRVSKAAKSDLPKVNINERRDIFETQKEDKQNSNSTITAAISESISVKIKDRISVFNQNLPNTAAKSPPKEVEIPTSTKLKDRLMSLNQLVSPTSEFEQDNSCTLSSQFSRLELAPNEVDLSVEKPNDETNKRTNENSSSHPYVTDLNTQQLLEIEEEEVKSKTSEDLESADMESSIIEEALDMAFEIIDNEADDPSEYMQVQMDKREPIYQNLDNNNYGMETAADNSFPKEMHYQVPRSREPYYVVPKSPARVHLYENVEMIFPNSSDSSRFSMAESNESFGVDDGTEMVFPVDQSKYLNLQPPKEKPPPLPEQNEIQADQNDNFRRINSTKRIKQEIQTKRFSFLGIEDNNINDFALELSVAPSPSMQALLKQEDKRMVNQLYQKSDNNNGNLDLGESRDSGLSDNHSRQSSEPSSNSSENDPNAYAYDMNNSGVPMSEMRGNYTSYSVNDDDSRIQSLENQISKQQTHPNVHHRLDTCDDDQQEVLRVEQILLQIEQQELKRQRESLMMRKKVARREFDEGVKLLMTNEPPPCDMPNNISRTNSNADVYSAPHYENVHMRHHHHNQSQESSYYINDYRKSMPNLQEQVYNEWQNSNNNIAISSPSHHQQNTNNYQNQYSNDMNAFSKSEMSLNHQNLAMRSYPPVPTHHHHPSNQSSDNAANRQVLMQICAVPKPKLTNEWIQYRKPDNPRSSLNSHWLIQEAEQRRIEQMNSLRTNNHGSGANIVANNRKSLPDSVIQSVQQRVHNAGLGINVSKRYTVFDSKYMPPTQQTPLLMLSTKNQQEQLQHQLESPIPHGTNFPMLPSMDVLSVSSKKLCNYCNYELGSGAAMIIENLGLFFHLDCFKCSVCQAAISDGNIQGTDVRVRNNKLHCKNCFSNEEGVKFSCV